MATEYIKRQLVIKLLCDYDCVETKDCPDGGCDLYRRIMKIKGADVRPVVYGAWGRPKGSTPRSWIFVCSKCGDRAYFPVPKYFPKGCGYNYCPNCGADMREEKNDER